MKVIRWSLLFGIAVLAFYMVRVTKSLLIPLVLAFFLWFLIQMLTEFFGELPLGRLRLPRQAAFVLALVVIVLAVALVADLIRSNIADVIDAAPGYEQNFERLMTRLPEWAWLDGLTDPEALGDSIELGGLIRASAATVADLLGSAGLVILFLFFLFFEARRFESKVEALFPDPLRRREVRTLLARVAQDTRTYVGLKTLVSILTAALSYVVMRAVGLDFAEFWALLIFILNFIPNIGSLIATVLPSLLALVQFDTLRPFVIIAGGVTAIQLFVANLVEPRLLGRSLNLSPLVIILSLFVWGSLWGIAGMFLCVPIMVVLMIVFSNFPTTRPIAVLLSETGRISVSGKGAAAQSGAPAPVRHGGGEAQD